MDLLLTGASGFVGRNLLLRAPVDWRILAVYRSDAGFPAFVASLEKPNISAVPCDLTNPDEASHLFENHGRDWDSCLYLAAKVDIPWSTKEPRQDLVCNVIPLLNLLEGLRARRFIYFSSGAVYDGLDGEVCPEAEVAPTLPYAISKLTSERYVQFYQARRKSIESYLIVRFFGAYGPYEAPHKIYTRLIQAFAIDREDTYTIYGDGRNLIDAMYIDDAIEAIRKMLAGSHWNDTVNLAAGRPMTIESLIREVASALAVSPVRIGKAGVAHESNRFWGSTREMSHFFGFEPKIALSEGITRFRDFLARP
jgi:nucleoside-diphosphate-sugar epimerase